MKKLLPLALLLGSAPAFAHVGHEHTSEHGFLHWLLGSDQVIFALGVALVVGVAAWMRPRW